jgi:hypothetical protein
MKTLCIRASWQGVPRPASNRLALMSESFNELAIRASQQSGCASSCIPGIRHAWPVPAEGSFRSDGSHGGTQAATRDGFNTAASAAIRGGAAARGATRGGPASRAAACDSCAGCCTASRAAANEGSAARGANRGGPASRAATRVGCAGCCTSSRAATRVGSAGCCTAGRAASEGPPGHTE